jgi:hypothetical protein
VAGAPAEAAGPAEPNDERPAPPPPSDAASIPTVAAVQPGAPDPSWPHIEGGLAIPFFVVVLAIFGAGINMMRQVPTIQAKHARILPNSGISAVRALMEAPVKPFASSTSNEAGPNARTAEAVHGIRKALIAQYMYLLSAPFLAIAVYYLLQVLATQISEPALVLMAFSSGLISDRIVSAIIRFAKKTLGGTDADEGVGRDDDREEARPSQPGAPPPTSPEPAAATQVAVSIPAESPRPEKSPRAES